MHDEDELLDLVNDKDEVIGTIVRSQIGQKDGYVRAAEMLIQNDKGELWIPRRTMQKRIAPGGLDFSGAGHVSSGEDYKTSLYREIEEELNLKIDESKLKLLKKFAPRPDLPPYFRAVYMYYDNAAPNYNPDDFSEYLWIKPQDLLKKLKAGEPAKQSLTETIEYLVAQEGVA
ncbi:MAG TPA: NUDIX domain-containing protein [Candidatus Saccharimonadales bacterium]|nr:NUDIX domain-containing protein [Candidatus Saccharimonadales bacterium]